MATYPTGDPFTFGLIPIKREQLKSLVFDTQFDWIKQNRVSYSPKINTGFGRLDPIRIEMQLTLNPTGLRVWLDYYNALPLNASQTLTIGLESYSFCVLESIEADFKSYIYKNSAEKFGFIETNISLVRAI